MFTTNFTVRSTQVDTFGHLNSAAYVEIYEWARWEWADEDGLDAKKFAEEQGIGPAIVHIDVSFHRELRHHDRVTVRTWFHAMEKIKATVAQEMIKEDGQVASSVLVTFVMFDLEKRKIVSMPDGIKRLYEADEAYRKSREK